MSEKKENKSTSNPYLFRYGPNNRFISGAIKNQIECPLKFEEFGESIVDKESYRLQLAGKSGAISSLNPSSNKGWYMFDDGKYDVHKDFSYIMRKDLSIVQIDEYTELLKEQLSHADESLKAQIEHEISQLNDKKEEVLTKMSTNSQTSEK